MKPSHYLTSHFLKRTAGVLLISTLTFLAACGNKGGDNAPPITPVQSYGFQNCLNCQNIGGAAFFTSESTDYAQTLRMNLTFAGQNTSITQSYPYNVGAMTPGTYNGPVSTSGTIVLTQPITNYYCVIPAGTYSVGTYQAGQWGAGIVYNLALQAVGPASLSISLTGQVSSPGWLAQGQPSSSTNPVGRLFGNLNVLSVNGQSCQQNIMIQ